MPEVKKYDRAYTWLFIFGLVAAVWFVFGQTYTHGFLNYDDGEYVYQNPQVLAGVTWPGVLWAFTHTYAANWHPLTWLSHMLDVQLFGLNAGAHHLTNVLLHSLTAVLLLHTLSKLTGNLWRSAFVAAVFALHPLRVESVAWIAERKDLLSGLFFVLTIASYHRYVRSLSLGSYCVALLLYLLGLLSKPMLVTLPLVLLLLDYWPLHRFAFLPSRKLLLEKLPFVALSAASVAVTLFAQTSALRSFTSISFSQRVANAVIAVATYLDQLFWPAKLVPMYPLDLGKLNALRVLISLAVILAITVLVLWQRQRRYLITGWLWYLIMLLPVIGLVQVGNQAHADRYTYLPLIGPVMALTWGVSDLAASWKTSLALSFAAVLTLLGVLSYQQTSLWRDPEILWSHTLACTSSNGAAEQNLAQTLHEKGKDTEAIAHFHRALALTPDDASVYSALGVVLLEKGELAASLEHLQKAVALNPKSNDAHYNLANTLAASGRPAEAVSEYRHALAGNPIDLAALTNLAWLLATSSDPTVRNGEEAIRIARRADELSRNASARCCATLSAAYAAAGQFEEALIAAQRALDLAAKDKDENLATSIRGYMDHYRLHQALP